MIRAAALALLLASAATSRADDDELRDAAEKSSTHLSLALGFGSAYDTGGLKLGLHRGSVELFGSTGWSWIDGSAGGALGLKFLGLNGRGAYAWVHGQISAPFAEGRPTSTYIGGGVGWRWRVDPWVVEVGLGYGLNALVPEGDAEWQWEWGVGRGTYAYLPDAQFAFGWEW